MKAERLSVVANALAALLALALCLRMNPFAIGKGPPKVRVVSPLHEGK